MGEFTITHEEFVEARSGKWQMVLTPTKPVPKEWYPDITGKRILGLASGGGQQMPIFAALGGECTVLGLLPKTDRERNYGGGSERGII